jgi:adenylate cyclase
MAPQVLLNRPLEIPRKPSSHRQRPSHWRQRWSWWLQQHTVLVLAALFCLGVGIALAGMFSLSSSLVQSQAIGQTTLYAQALEEARSIYATEAVGRVKTVPGVQIMPDYADHLGAMPVPATYMIELGRNLSVKNEKGMVVRLYSDWPFPWRRGEGGARDGFEKEALVALRRDAKASFIRFETLNGRSVLRYAQADVMKQTCVECHNTRLDSPKRDWRVGDVRGALEITMPLDAYLVQTWQGLRGMALLLVGMAGLALLGIATVVGRLRNTTRELEERVTARTIQLSQTNVQLQEEQEKSERLLLNILPGPIAHQLKNGEQGIADGFASVTILFADLVNFTQLAEEVAPKELVELLNDIFCRFDRLTEKFGLEKIKTIGDAYMVVGGMPCPRHDHAQAIAAMALAMGEEVAAFNRQYGQQINLRIGINTGPVVAGVIGQKKFIYDLWGDTVNVASRMESHGISGEIQVTQSTYECLRSEYLFEARGDIEVKGKGRLPAYLLKGCRLPFKFGATGVRNA